MVKQVDGAEFDVVKRTIAATKLSDETDSLVFAGVCDENEYVVLQSGDGYFLKFLVLGSAGKEKGSHRRPGIRLGAGDFVEHAYLLANGMDSGSSTKRKKSPWRTALSWRRETEKARNQGIKFV